MSGSERMAQQKITTGNVAVVHDWLPLVGGAERVVQQMVRAFPNSTLYTLFDFLSDAERSEITSGVPIHTSRLNSWPGVRRYYRYLILQCTRAIEEFDVTGHDLVLSSSAALAKGVLTSPDQVHVSYIHSPVRYAWDLTHDYINSIDGVGRALKRKVAREMMHRLRLWDMRSVAQVDHMIANSHFIRKRIWKTYRREAEVIYPPVDTDRFHMANTPRDDFFFTASRMVPYKRIDLIVETFTARPDLKLVVCGDGPEMARIRALAGQNIAFLGHAPFDVMRDHMQRARGFVFAAKEDFGIVPVEAQACGTPVIALDQGGTAETVRGPDDGAATGVHFSDQTPDALGRALREFEEIEGEFDAEMISTHARRFSSDRFVEELRSFVASVT
ncbi:glycosyltransferase [Aliiroseovarius crassostreae]|uniref:glycosyltransferase n=1 Tax=Aliiroseovarius crassostreae TaxID=154981 RepID=UPI003C7BF227